MKIPSFVLVIAVFVPASFQASSQRPTRPVDRVPSEAVVEANRVKPAIKKQSEGFRGALQRSSGAEIRARMQMEKAKKP